MPRTLSFAVYRCEQESCDGPVVYCTLSNGVEMKPYVRDLAKCIGCGKEYDPNQLKGSGPVKAFDPIEWE